MLYLHEVHEVVAGRMDDFETLAREDWRSWIEERGDARLCWDLLRENGT